MASGVIRNFSKTLPNLVAENGLTIRGQKGARAGDIVSYNIEFLTTKQFNAKEPLISGFQDYEPTYAGMGGSIGVSWHITQLYRFCLWYDNNVAKLVPLETIPADTSIRLSITYVAA